MIAVSFLDAFAGARGISPERDPVRSAEIARLAAAYVDSALADWQRVLQCEDHFGAMAFDNAADQSRANRSLYDVYQAWAADAEQVLARTRALVKAGCCVQNADDLEHAVGRVQARLNMTPEKFDRAREQIRQGLGIPLEEVRSELRARIRA